MADHSSVNGETREVTAAEANKGWRLDHMLARALPELSRSRLQGLIAEGRVRLMGELGATIRDPNKRVKPGEVFEVHVPPPTPAGPEPQAIPLVIVHEDADLIVIDKPAGLVVHPAAGNLDGTLVNALLAHCGESLKGIGGVARPGIVHRLDKDTSGLLVVAKNERAMRSLAKQFAAHAVERAYNAVVWGSPRAGTGIVEGNLGRNPFDRKRMAVLREQGKPARTRYRMLEQFGVSEKPFAALVECRLETGRTHQIRVHLAHIGHPLLGDSTYGRARRPPRAHTPEEQTAYEAAISFPRQALHAGLLGFFHPTRQEKMRFESPWPEDFAALVKALRGTGASSGRASVT
jgi:23S rRNA pseudouridine1911/1915/1917 synthase